MKTTTKDTVQSSDNNPIFKLRSMLQINARVKVKSSNVDSVGFFRKSKGFGTLEVAFVGGGVYQYVDVPESIYKEMMTSPSVGQYFIRNIKSRYETKKMQ